jgi:hypothetical protein
MKEEEVADSLKHSLIDSIYFKENFSEIFLLQKKIKTHLNIHAVSNMSEEGVFSELYSCGGIT